MFWKNIRQERRVVVFLAAILFMAGLFFLSLGVFFRAPGLTLKIYDLETGQVYASVSAKPGSKLFFGWTHSLEQIPWNEYYHVDENFDLILDTITFPAFGAGIPEDKGHAVYIKGGLIYMDEIGERFSQIVWLNSHTATNDILFDGKLVARGSSLPQHRRLKLIIEREE